MLDADAATLSNRRAEKLFREAVYFRREEQWTHTSYAVELAMLNSITLGDVERVSEGFSLPSHGNTLSNNPHRQAIYDFITTVTLLTRAAVAGGLDNETAYCISDAYIKTADMTKLPSEVYALYDHVLMDFATKVRKAQREKQCLSLLIMRCVEYIESHLHYTITLGDMAEALKCNAAYLCAQFKKEIGMSVTRYINKAKIDEAKLLLTVGGFSAADAAVTLGFCSQSYFTKLFREITGDTPYQYQKKYRIPKEQNLFHE